MEASLLFQKIIQQYQNKIPFIVFALPDSNEITGYLQSSSSRYINENFEQPGAILAPFNNEEHTYFIPLQHAETIKTSIEVDTFQPISEVLTPDDNVTKTTYEALVHKSIDTIKNSELKKVVTSRKKEIALASFDFEKLLNSLFSLNPTAFRYCWYHPETSIWCGATPEVLVQKKENSFKTMALAGTMKYEQGILPIWGLKEKNEQKLVIEAISNSLEKLTSVLRISKTYSQPAGTLVHLRTDIDGVIKKSKSSLKSITTALHPTPAVCGTPKELAKKHINEHEGYNREFYTGFVGIIKPEAETSSVFVNLRCMKLEPNKATLYVGGGITEDSNPELEYIETQNKLQTMMQVLQPLL
jgi:isochorismate synthase